MNKNTKKIDIALNKIKEKNPGIEIIYLAYSGSVLHGTNTENSDLDIKGLFIPTKNSLLLGQAPTVLQYNSNKNMKNTNEDIDFELFSVSEFLRLLSKGEINSLDILFSMFSDKVLLETEVSEMFKAQYKQMLTKNVKAFVGFAMKQATLSSNKGTRLSDLEFFYNLLRTEADKLTEEDLKKKRLGDFKHSFLHFLPKFKKEENIFLYFNEVGDEGLYVLGKNFILRTPINLVLKSLKSTLDSYGERSKNTKINQGKDFKAISHALRAIEEGIELLENEFIKFPLKKAQEIKNIKMGLMREKEEIDTLLEGRISVLKELSMNSQLPETMALNKNEFLLNIYSMVFK